MYVLDFETHPIVDFAPLLPEPVGCSIVGPDHPPHYYAWGHPTENNCTKEQFAFILRAIWDKEILTHNGATFDIPIAEHWFGLPRRDPLLTHDTLFIAYLHNPHARSLGLKDLAADWLGIPPDAQSELVDWIMANTECTSRRKAGAFIYLAPGGLAGRYANDDCLMTGALWRHIAPKVLETMQEPYDRERRLAPILVDMQLRGVPCDVERLRADTLATTKRLHALDAEIRKVLKYPNLSLDSNDELVAALRENGYTGFLVTPTGKTSAAKDSLDKALADAPTLREMLDTRATLATLVTTFMEPWLTAATANGGRIHASYNQTRNPEGFGTRTGRLSSTKPNFQNVPGDFGADFPLMRSYLLPEPGSVWVCGDFKNQEPRLAAHFEDSALCRAFNEDPELDPYLFVVDLIGGITRKESKVIFLGLLYAMGIAMLAEKLKCEPERASMLRTIIKGGLPGLVKLDYDCKRRFQLGLPIRTLGGRTYFCEPPANGRTWEYKALNTLIQGSAADQTKEAIIYIAERLLPGERVLGTVHDEISVSCHPDRVPAIMDIFQEAANALPCDVPMLMDTNHGASWAGAK